MALMIALAYHHGLRVSELISLEWSAIDLKAGTIVDPPVKGRRRRAQHLCPTTGSGWQVFVPMAWMIATCS